MDKNLGDWNPMEEHYRNRRMNSYREGMGQDFQNRDDSDIARTNGAEDGRKPTSLYIANIPLDMDEKALENLFVQQGKVVSVHIPQVSPEKVAKYKSKIGFVTMDNMKGALEAVHNLNGFLLKDKALIVSVKLSKEEIARKRERQARQDEILQRITTGRESEDGAASIRGDGVENRGAGPPGAYPGPVGDGASVNSLTVTVQNDSGRRVQGTPNRGSNHPMDTQSMGAASPALMLAGRGQPVNLGTLRAGNMNVANRAPSVAGDVTNYCAFCHRAATLRCQACKTVYYCAAQCQKNHWQIHRRSCVYDARVAPVPQPTQSPLLPEPDFENMEVTVSDEFVQSNRRLADWLQAAETRSESSGSSGGRRHSRKPNFFQNCGPKQQQQSRTGGRQEPGSHSSQPYPPQKGSNGQTEPAKNKEQNAGPNRQSGPQPTNGEGRFNQQQQRNDRPGPQLKNMSQGPNESGKPRGQPQDKFQNQQRKAGPGSYQSDESQKSSGENNGRNQFQQGPKNGPQDRSSQPRKEGQGPQQIKGGPNQNGAAGQGAGRQQQGERGWNQKQNHNKPGQFQQEKTGNKGSPKQNQDPNFKQQDRNNNRNRNDQGASRNNGRPGLDAGDSGKESWKDETPKSPPQAVQPSPASAAPVLPETASSASEVVPATSSAGPTDLLELNKPITVVVSYMDSPQSFWVQIAEQGASVLSALNQVLQTYTGRGNPAKSARQGEMFLCEFMGELARVRVVSVSGGSVKVFYVDYGNSEDTQVSKLLPLPAEIADLPCLGLHCCLQVVPSSGKEWPVEAVAALKELFSEVEMCSLTPLSKADLVPEVSLVRSSDSLDATAFLIENGYGISQSAEAVPETSTPQRKRNDQEEPRRGARSGLKKGGSDGKETLKDKTPKSPPQAETPASQSSPAAGATSQVVQATSEAGPVDLLQLNESITVLVSYMDSPQSFWIQIVEQGATVLPALSQALQSYTGRGNPAKNARQGEMFLCEFMGELARVRVVSVSGGSVKVFYVDYGNSEDTQVSKLLPLPAEIADLPCLGVHCCLQVVPSSGKEWPAESVAALKEVFSEVEVCTLTTLNKAGPVPEVSLVRSSDGLDATAFLIDKGFGVAKSAEPTAKLTAPQRVMVANMHSIVERLKVGQKVELMFLDTTSPTDLFMRIFSLESALHDFTFKMVADYNCSPDIPYVPVVGELVVGRFSLDKLWYRAEVLDVAMDKEEASLCYVDFGNKECLSFREVRPIKPEYAAHPIHGFRCAIGGISAPAGGRWNDEHTAVYITCLQKYLGQDGKCTVLIESLKDMVVWIDVVSSQLQLTLSEDLSQQVEAALLPQPIQPKVVTGSPLPRSETVPPLAPAAKPEVMPALESKSPVPPQKEPVTKKRPLAATPVKQPSPFEMASLSLNEVVVCGIQEIASCLEFYVNKKEAEEGLNILREQLNTFCEGCTKDQPEACKTVSQGDLVLVQFSADSEWYRGRVERIFNSGSKCRVFFVDYGNMEDKVVFELKVLPPKFLEMPAQAITCKLAGVPPPVSEEIEVRFKSTCLQTEVGVKAVGKQDDGYFVEVITNDNQSVTSILGIQSGRKANPHRIAPGSNTDRSPSAASDKLLPSQKMSQASPVPGNAASPVSEEGKSSSQLSVNLQPKPRLTVDCLEHVLPEQNIPKEVVVTHVISPSHFYVASVEHYVAQFQPGGLIPQLKTLSESASPLDSVPGVGDLLSGLFTGDWYRCEVIEVMTPRVRVNFFDYGNEAVVDLTDLRPLPADLCSGYPLATFRCAIHGIKPTSGESYDDETVLLTKELLENQFFLLTVKSKQASVHHVTVINQTTEEDVGKKLLDLGKVAAQGASEISPEKAELLRQMKELEARLASM